MEVTHSEQSCIRACCGFPPLHYGKSNGRKDGKKWGIFNKKFGRQEVRKVKQSLVYHSCWPADNCHVHKGKHEKSPVVPSHLHIILSYSKGESTQGLSDKKARSKSKNLKWKAGEREQKRKGKARKIDVILTTTYCLFLNVFQHLALHTVQLM